MEVRKVAVRTLITVRFVPGADVGTGSPVVAAMDGFTGAASPVAPGTAVLHRFVRAICQVKQV